MQIQLLAGDHDWSEEGTHVLDDNGYAIILSESKIIDISEEIHGRIIPIIEGCRVFRGLNPDGTVPVPEEAPLASQIPDEP